MKLFTFVLLLPFSLFSQQHKADTVFCDCKSARIVTIDGKAIVRKTIAPPGPGAEDEISTTKLHTRFAFAKEHHSAWYKLVIKSSGTLTFDITPEKRDDDYDFMLFRAESPRFCDSMLKHGIKPVRACISRDKQEIDGHTGLNDRSKEKFIAQGLAAAYAEAINVKAGEVYYLALDNVYEQGGGHSIRFSISSLVVLSGTVFNDDGQPLKAEITLSALDGKTILETQTTAAGSYSFTQMFMANQDYVITFYNDSNFLYTRSVSVSDSVEMKDLKTVLPSLKKGSKQSIGTINFFGGSTQHLPAAEPALRKLYKLMRKNPNLQITIIGHCNGFSTKKEKGGVSINAMDLSLDRARAVKDYLTKRGIEPKRIQTTGKGDSEMLFPPALLRTERQQEANRRVELMVRDF